MKTSRKCFFDFEIHSRYAMACSAQLTLPNIADWAGRKGVNVIGTGDFTHPKWFAEIREQLQEQDNGLLKIKGDFLTGNKQRAAQTQFILSAEISSIYSHNGKTRRIHNLLLAPSIAVVSQLIARLEKRGAKLAGDGRPIVGISSKELLQIVLDVSPECMLVPAHVWTPYFGLFGSMSGYDSVEECFEDMAPEVKVLETGLSADPEMFWRISQFDRFTLVSCSDPHSLPRIGRECNVLQLPEQEWSYTELTRILKEKDRTKFLHTLEYYPEEGRYHYDGHRDCKVSMHPSETAKHKGICPVCSKRLTIGVLSRAEELADRPVGFKPPDAIPGQHFVVLEEIIAEGLAKAVSSKKVQQEYMRITQDKTEFEILFDLSVRDLEQLVSPEISEAILKVRQGQVQVTPGYDGEYGKIKLFDGKKAAAQHNMELF